MIHPFTDTYIAMAMFAKEIQAMRGSHRDFQVGDWYLNSYLSLNAPLVVENKPAVTLWQAWLPRLDQLLGMLDRDKDYSAVIHGLADDVADGGDWCEVVLVHIMFSQHGKTWDGKGWVKGY